MPLQRDQASTQTGTKSAASFVNDRQHVRTNESDRGPVMRPLTPQQEFNKSLTTKSADINPRNAISRHHLPDDDEFVRSRKTPNLYKIPVQNTMEPPQPMNVERSLPRKGGNPALKQERQSTTGKLAVNQRPSVHYKQSVFDDTASLDQSFLDPTFEGEQTAIIVPQRSSHGQKPQDGYSNPFEVNPSRTEYDMHNDLDAALGPHWREEVQAQRLHVAQEQLTEAIVLNGGQHSTEDLRNDSGLETPSRTQSAPPFKDKIEAPIPQKNVNFAMADEIVSFSPDLRSLDMAREDSLKETKYRPTSAQSRAQKMIQHAKPQERQQHPQSPLRPTHVTLPSHSDRFRHLVGRRQSLTQDTQKVSAPESDNQDLSEDERVTTESQVFKDFEAVASPSQQDLPRKKRSHDDMSRGLDYSIAILKEKKLSDLQAEAFSQDPGLPPKSPPTDSMGNEMPLAQTLENLIKVPENAQRETFRALSDEQWARTGRWFVDKFQADLADLTRIRLERRKIALNYEDKIRRRQRLVEHHETVVNKELQELQTGGKQLVDGRKVPSGSRSGTPLKKHR